MDKPLLAAQGLSFAYGGKPILTALDFSAAAGEITVIIGPNGAGKSTLLALLAGVSRPAAGSVSLKGANLATLSRREVARSLAILPQTPEAPQDIRLRELVTFGRHPRRAALAPWTAADDAAVNTALAQTGLTDLAGERLSHLSGGQRQRAWIAMVLAQETEVLLLDEPTSHLDIAHQFEILELLRDQARRRKLSVIVVMHDLSRAAQFADHLCVLAGGQMRTLGPTAEVLASGLLSELFGVRMQMVQTQKRSFPVPTGLAARDRRD
ncbi:MAG: ABC transporter ATP-binding protein [Pseudomonadota bacterium]